MAPKNRIPKQGAANAAWSAQRKNPRKRKSVAIEPEKPSKLSDRQVKRKVVAKEEEKLKPVTHSSHGTVGFFTDCLRMLLDNILFNDIQAHIF